MKFFNTAGPVNCDDHYCLPPLGRFNPDEILKLIGKKKYIAAQKSTTGIKSWCGGYRKLFLPAMFKIFDSTMAPWPPPWDR